MVEIGYGQNKYNDDTAYVVVRESPHRSHTPAHQRHHSQLGAHDSSEMQDNGRKTNKTFLQSMFGVAVVMALGGLVGYNFGSPIPTSVTPAHKYTNGDEGSSKSSDNDVDKAPRFVVPVNTFPPPFPVAPAVSIGNEDPKSKDMAMGGMGMGMGMGMGTGMGKDGRDNLGNLFRPPSDAVFAASDTGPYASTNPERCATAEYRHGMRRKRKKKEYGSVSAIYDTPEQIAGRKGYIHLDCRGQWGNHLGQYAVARVVAEELNFGLWVCPTLLDANWKKGHIFPRLGELAFDETQMKGLEEIEYGKHSYHLQELIKNNTPRVLHMWGYPFDDMWLFGKYRERIREVFKLDVGCIYWNQTYPEPEDVVVHIRGYSMEDCKAESLIGKNMGNGDKPNFNPKESFVDPPFEYYRVILEKMKAEQGGWGKLWLASRCGLNDPVAARIAKEFGAVLTPPAEVHGDMADFLFISVSKRLIMSQSTFAWWAAFLGGGEREVHYPLVGEWWGKRPRHRLYPDESRYIFHDLYSEPFHMFLTKKQIQSDIDNLKPVW